MTGWGPLYDMGVPLGGLQIVESLYMVDRVEDWSLVRSLSRAKRRRAQGHRQHVRHINVPKPGAMIMGRKAVMHPVVAHQLRELAKKEDWKC